MNTRSKRKQRIRKKIIGSTKRPRISVFRSNKHIYAQAIDDSSSKTLASSSDIKIEKGKATKSEIAKKIGTDLGKKLKDKKIDEVVYDRSGYKFHGRVKNLAEGLRESGIKF